MAREKTRIKIKDLPREMQVSREEMKKVMGGFLERFPNVPLSLQKLRDVLYIDTVPLPE